MNRIEDGVVMITAMIALIFILSIGGGYGLIAVLAGLIPAAIARSRGSAHFFGWWAFGAGLWIVAMPMALIRRNEPKEEMLDLMRKQVAATVGRCSSCHESVAFGSAFCPHCGAKF